MVEKLTRQSAPSIQELVEKLRRELEKECPSYPALLNVVRVECPCSDEADLRSVDGVNHAIDLGMCAPCWVANKHSERCQCGGYAVTRKWKGMPPGALRGAIEDAVEGTDLEDAYHSRYDESWIKQRVSCPTNGPAAEALLTVLSQEEKRG